MLGKSVSYIFFIFNGHIGASPDAFRKCVDMCIVLTRVQHISLNGCVPHIKVCGQNLESDLKFGNDVFTWVLQQKDKKKVRSLH